MVTSSHSSLEITRRKNVGTEETEEAAEEVIIYKKNSRNSFRKIFFRK